MDPNSTPANPPSIRSELWLLIALALGIALIVGGLTFWLIPPSMTPLVSPLDVKTEPRELTAARAHLAQGRPDLAVRDLATIQIPSPAAAEVMTRAGQAFLMGQDLGPARRSLERALGLDPDQAVALKLLAAIYLTFSDAPRAIKLLERATRLDPEDFHPWYALGKAHAGQGEPDRAATAFAAALDRHPPPDETREIQRGLARAWLDAGRADAAGPVLTTALALSPANPELLGLAARQAHDEGDAAAALSLADRALTIEPTNLDALLTRARCRRQAGQPEAALPDLALATTLNPNDLMTLQLRFQVESQLNQRDAAAQTARRVDAARARRTSLSQLARAISQRPSDPEPRWRMGQVAAEADQTTLAAQCFAAALDLDPDCGPARAGLAALAATNPAPPPVRPNR